MRRLLYITGTRADYGLMRTVLAALQTHEKVDLQLAVTGMHLVEEFGNTWREIEADGYVIGGRVPVETSAGTGAEMARAIGAQVTGFVSIIESLQPDVVLVLGDRGEMLAGTIAAVHLGCFVAHIHGGERSGTIDESIRHAISKLAHLHFVATRDSRERLVRMGELPAQIHVTGAPGLDGILAAHDGASREEICLDEGLDPQLPVALMVYHPVIQEAAEAGRQVRDLIECTLDAGLQLLCLRPNSDAGRTAILDALERFAGDARISVRAHLGRPRFLSWMRHANVMIGNSSSGIIEAASFGIPVVNVGTRQALRERNANVFDARNERADLKHVLETALAAGRFDGANVYGDGHAAERIRRILAESPLEQSWLSKANVY